MKKLLKLIATLIVLLIIAALAAPYFISTDKLKPIIISKIEAATGRHLQIDGAFQLRFFPIAGVTLEKVSLLNPPIAGDTEPLMQLKSLDVNIAVIPLLSGDIEIKKLVLDEPDIHLHVAKNGSKNWLPPQAAAASQSASPAAAAAPSQSTSNSFIPLRNLVLSDVKLSGGIITYHDENTKQQWNLEKINAVISLNGASSPLIIDASSEWNGKKISVKGTLSTLESLLAEERSKLEADIDSDLFSVSMQGAIDKSVYAGKASVKSASLKALQAWLTPAAAPLATPAKLALNLTSDVECGMSFCNLLNANLSLDAITAKGTLKINAAAGQKPQIDANLTTNTLDFNPFLTSEHACLPALFIADAQAQADGHWSDKPIDLSGLEALNANATLIVDGLIFNKITLGKTTLKIAMQNGQLKADVIDAVMYGGTGNISLMVNSPANSFEKHATLKGVQIQPLLKDAAGLSRLSGTADITMNATSHGKSERELVSAAGGSGNFSLNNGAIEGLNLSDMVHNIGTAFKLADSAGQKTPISEMKGSFTIAQGVLTNNDLVITSPTLHIAGQGNVNLPAYTINYRLTPQIMQAANGTTASKEGVGVPILVQGSLEKPTFKPDANALVQNALKDPQAFKEQLKNTRESLKDQLKDPNAVNNIKNMLKGF